MTIQKKQIITIAGLPGSGKSTTAIGAAKQLGFKHFSSGDLFRAVSLKHGQDVLASNLAAEKAEGISEIDELVDQRLRDLGVNEDSLVIDSRMAWHWMPYSFKVFLSLDMQIAADRITKNMTPERMQAEHIPDTTQEYAQSLQDRLDSESRRYKKMYNVDPYNLENYDLVVDTSNLTPNEVIQLVLEKYSDWRSF